MLSIIAWKSCTFTGQIGQQTFKPENLISQYVVVSYFNFFFLLSISYSEIQSPEFTSV